jgi:hypothetical protein
MKPQWGIYDTQENIWYGDETGPKLFDDENVAKVAAMVMDVRLKQRPGRTRQREYREANPRLRDSVETRMTTEEALEHIEKGGL